MFRRFYLFIIVLVFTVFNPQGANKPYISPTPGVIPIMACSPFPDGVSPTLQGYKDILDCGFNIVTSVSSLDYYEKQFKILGNLPLKYVISNGDLRSERRYLFIDPLKNDPHLGGWLFMDEPPFDNLVSLSKRYEELYEAVPSNFILMNLVGKLHAPGATGNFTSYYNYLKYIQSLFEPGVWSMDIYPVYVKNGKITVFYDLFYTAMDSMSRISQETNRPFWSFALSMKHRIGQLEYAEATLEILRYQIFTALAYGAQGIAYWTYGMRRPTETETYISALVGLDGKKSKAWYAAQQVNSEVRKYNDIFLGCNVIEVRHTGDRIYKGTKKLSGSIGELKAVRSESAGVVVSRITNNGKKYYVLVNRDVTDSQKVSIEIKPNYMLLDVCGEQPKSYTWREDITFILEPGGYQIFEVSIS